MPGAGRAPTAAHQAWKRLPPPPPPHAAPRGDLIPQLLNWVRFRMVEAAAGDWAMPLGNKAMWKIPLWCLQHGAPPPRAFCAFSAPRVLRPPAPSTSEASGGRRPQGAPAPLPAATSHCQARGSKLFALSVGFIMTSFFQAITGDAPRFSDL